MVNGPVLWRCASRAHDWWSREYPGRLLAVAAACGVVGDAEWVEAGAQMRRKAAAVPAAELGRGLFAHARPAGGKLILRAGGSAPHEWRVFILLFPYHAEKGRAEGYSMIGLEFAPEPFEDEAGSRRLKDVFREAHGPDDTEAAFIHPARRWEDLAAEVFRPPLVTVPTFAGVFWANFLGPGHLDNFDTDRLRDLPARNAEWVGERGLFLFPGGALGEAESPETEREMTRLTEQLRGALRGE